jgi:bifunctional non-homologous end joining protein LigD
MPERGYLPAWLRCEERAGAHHVIWLFDLLELDGRDFRALPLGQRRQRLEDLLRLQPPGSPFRYSESFDDPAALLAAADRLGLEGIVSKRLDAPYRSGHRPEWVKVKTETWRKANRERWRLFDATRASRRRDH